VTITPSSTDYFANAQQLVAALDDANNGFNAIGDICYPYNIYLQGGTYDLNGPDVYLPSILNYRSVILHGANSAGSRALLNISATNNVHTQSLAALTLRFVIVTNNNQHDGRAGGGGFVNGGTLAIYDSIIRDNAAVNEAGAILNYGDLTIERTTFSGNTASAGGAIKNDSGTLVITCSSFLNNHADWHGAILQTVGTSVTITKSKFVGNTATIGGGGAIGTYSGASVSAVNNWWGADGLVPEIVEFGASTNTLGSDTITVEPIAPDDPMLDPECLSEAQTPTPTPTSTNTPIPLPTPVPVLGPQKVLVLLCKFSDIPVPSSGRFSHTWLQDIMTDVAPGIDWFWKENSYNNVNIPGIGGPGTNVLGWFTINNRTSYIGTIQTGAFNRLQAAQQCFNEADIFHSSLLPNYDANNNGTLIFVFNGLLEGTMPPDKVFFGILTDVPIFFKFAHPHPYWNILISERGYKTGPGTIAHEIAHRFGFSHSGGPYGADYDSQWDVMSDSDNGCRYDLPSDTYSTINSFNPPDPTWGCRPAGTIAINKYKAGWIPSNRHTQIDPSSSRSVILQDLAQPSSNWAPGQYLMARVPIAGSSQYYTVEVRGNVGIDTRLPKTGVIIHLITPGQNPLLIDIDARDTTGAGYICNNGIGGNPNDEGARWLETEKFVDHIHNITISVIAYQASTFSYEVLISNGLGTPPTPIGCP
jgi:hypothetical protein